MAWDEWQQLKSDAAERGAVRTRIDSAPSAGPAGGADLVVRQDDLGAVGHEAFSLFDRMRERVDIAGAGADKSGAGTSLQAATELKSHGFSAGDELSTTVEVWTSQIKSVLQACAHISNHLDYTRKAHAADDAKIAAQVKTRAGSAIEVSVLDSYFK
ncbi:hypothetical protein AB0K92_22890 [Streptomyces sp. NPDC052687]|uniref:hypothetical protein n=1 Tax=unclassified Streptomyces TaxID=2593676 RepID=UPI001408802A|nr:hypothetical protein [Streptomyces sp. JB150]QIJ62674.1 hypothetical protein G7Z13_11965 [Streptomyces sp. JB150]